MKKTETLGAWGEQAAAGYLRKKGFRVLETNYCCRWGEIDIIAQNKEYLVFAEVKLRKDDSHGTAREFVTGPKQAKIRRTAEIYLSENPSELQPRFDVVEIYAPEGRDTKNLRITHLEDAFA